MREARVIALLMALVLTACANWDSIAGSWVGKKADDLIFNWGPPAAVYELDDGRKTLTFIHHRLSGGPQGSQSLYCIVTFGANERGVIQTFVIDGNIGGCNRLFGNKSAAQ